MIDTVTIADEHWAVEPTSYHPDHNYKDRIALYYDRTPGGRKNEDGSTSYSMRIPALLVTDWVADRQKVALEIASQLNAFDDMLKALKAARTVIHEDRNALFESVTVASIASTMDEIDKPHVDRLDIALAQIEAAIAKAEGQP